ncbi:MAG TPA: hypothetical protein VFS00_08905, partial [Polyangiaceae bacterium]|nr:hypothetical protein [Polyangiaceae bacterium]
ARLAPAHHTPAHHAPAHHAPSHHAPAISPLAETGPAGEPTSHVDPFGPTVEGAAEARPGASPLSITVKPGEKRPEFLMPAARAPNARAPGATPQSGLPLTVPDRKPAHTPDGGVARPAPYPPSPAGQAPPGHSSSYPPAGGGQPYASVQAAPGGQGYGSAQAAPGGQGYRSVQAAPGGQGYASAQATPGGQGYASAQAAPGGQGYPSPPAGGSQGYASPLAGGSQPYAPSPNGGNHAYGASPAGGSQSHGALPAAGHLYGPPPTPQGSRSSRPAPEPMTGYGLPAGQAPLRALEGSGGMMPLPATPSQLPPEPAAQPKVGSALKPMLAWSLVVLALAAALGGVVYLIVLYVRKA